MNLETSITANERYERKGINYRMNPKNIPCLAAAGVDCCVVANNHILDWGEAGLIETVVTLESAGIQTAGAGRNRNEAAKPAIIDVARNGRVVVFAFGAGTSGIPRRWAASEKRPGINRLENLSDQTIEAIAQDVAAIKKAKDIVVFSIHWGANWGYDVAEDEIAFAHGLIDRASVDVVYGHSSHHVKAIEVYKGKPIFYGCGDFLNDYEGIEGYAEFRGDLTLMYFLTFGKSTGQLVELTMTPLRISNFSLRKTSAEDTRWLQERLDRECRAFGTAIVRTADDRFDADWTRDCPQHRPSADVDDPVDEIDLGGNHV